MKLLRRSNFLLLSMFLLCACSNDMEPVSPTCKNIVMTASDFDFGPLSRTSITITDRGGEFSWAEHDTVGIFPDTGAQVYFPMIDGQGTKKATFTGGGWALRPSSTYAAYYPFIADILLNQKKIPVSYEGQVQQGNANTSHLGAFDYMAARATTPVEDGVNFEFQHLGALIELSFNPPFEGELKSLTLSADIPFFTTRGCVDLTDRKPVVKTLSATNTCRFDFRNIVPSSKNNSVKIYFLMAPKDLTGHNLNAVLSNGAKSFQGMIVGKNLEAGKGYQLAMEIPQNQWVDMGLSVKWASYNLGASSPEDPGAYYAWGETTAKSNYIPDNSTTNGKTMNSISGDPQYDAAALIWGNGARIPTQVEMDELRVQCSWNWTTVKGVDGYQVVSKKNGNSIFLPAVGYYEDAALKQSGAIGKYWSASPTINNTSQAFALDFSQSSLGVMYLFCQRYMGFSIRPVCNR